jgi:hypothetical protein
MARKITIKDIEVEVPKSPMFKEIWKGDWVLITHTAPNHQSQSISQDNPIFAATASTEWKHQFWNFLRKYAKKHKIEMIDVDPFDMCESFPKADKAAEQHKLWIEVYEALLKG